MLHNFFADNIELEGLVGAALGTPASRSQLCFGMVLHMDLSIFLWTVVLLLGSHLHQCLLSVSWFLLTLLLLHAGYLDNVPGQFRYMTSQVRILKLSVQRVYLEALTLLLSLVRRMSS